MHRIMTFREHRLNEEDKSEKATEKAPTKAELMDMIGQDLKTLRLDGRAPDRIGKERDGFSADFRNLGKWTNGGGNPKDDDWSGKAADVWDKGEEDKYKKMFKKFIDGREWADKVQFEVETGDKRFAYFVVTVAPPEAAA
jgi:hypothetical protein